MQTRLYCEISSTFFSIWSFILTRDWQHSLILIYRNNFLSDEAQSPIRHNIWQTAGFFYTTYRQIFWLFYWITSEWILLNFEQICHNDLSKLTIISVPFLTYNRLSQMDIFEVENLKCKKKGIKVETIQIYFQHDFVSVFCWKISSSTKISFLWRVLLLYRNL